jgi:hypothetical protein
VHTIFTFHNHRRPLNPKYLSALARLEKEEEARKTAERKAVLNKPAKSVVKIPRPEGSAGEDYSIIVEMKLENNKELFKAIQVSLAGNDRGYG